MKTEYRFILQLLRSALTGERADLPPSVDWGELFTLINAHQIVPIVFYGLNNSKIKTPYDEKLFELTSQNVIIEQRQLDAIQKLGAAFSAAGVDHAFLKGSRMKLLYPQTEMRVMGDLDVLIKDEQYDKIKPIMRQLGFLEGNVWDYEYHWGCGEVQIELHKALMPSDEESRDFYNYFGKGWPLLLPLADTPCRYEMPPEDELLFLLTHLVKHYRFSGIGLRQFLDFFIYNQKHPQLDGDRLQAGLKELGLDEFYGNLLYTLQTWFEGAEETEVTRIITDRVFKSGSYGNSENNSVATAAANSKSSGGVKRAKLKELFNLVFLPLSGMREKYPFLSKAPVLLPVMWVVRWVAILFKPKNIRCQANRIQKYNSDTIAAFEQSLKRVGL